MIPLANGVGARSSEHQHGVSGRLRKYPSVPVRERFLTERKCNRWSFYPGAIYENAPYDGSAFPACAHRPPPRPIPALMVPMTNPCLDSTDFDRPACVVRFQPRRRRVLPMISMGDRQEHSRDTV
jgi:hypothetical protein